MDNASQNQNGSFVRSIVRLWAVTRPSMHALKTSHAIHPPTNPNTMNMVALPEYTAFWSILRTPATWACPDYPLLDENAP